MDFLLKNGYCKEQEYNREVTNMNKNKQRREEEEN